MDSIQLTRAASYRRSLELCHSIGDKIQSICPQTSERTSEL